MSTFLSAKYRDLEPYTPGEQPRDMQYVKLNTNESPFPPSEKARKRAQEVIGRLQLYSDPECTELVQTAAGLYGISPEEILFSNGSDEILDFIFMAYCDEEHPAVFPDITYGFYPVFAQINRVPYEEIPLEEDFSIDPKSYQKPGRTVFLANPNAPTGIALSLEQIEEILQSHPENVVVIDEAYVDFGAESCIPLIHRYNNLLVVQTFSKSRSLAGARLGFAVGNRELIRDLRTVKYSVNPYNVNSMTMAAGIGALEDEEYRIRNCAVIMENRAYTERELQNLGFSMTSSSSNFIFVKHPKIPGEELYLELKKRGVLIRHFSKERIRDYNRITIGTREQMDILIREVREILDSRKS
ncbi:MAG: histidinol-phosphate transaminase [Parasporobacterium sp.]|nr:histidinol-phosphate transaminase [Parasporobacterium sp.]